MRTCRGSIWQVGILGLVLVSTGVVYAQPPTAAWVGVSRDNANYAFPPNWIEPATGQSLTIAPDAHTDVFFRFEAGQAPRDPEGNVVVALRQEELAAQSMSVEVLPFRLTGGGTLTVGEEADTDQGVLVVENGGVLTLDPGTLRIRDSVFVGGGPSEPGETGLLRILPGGQLHVGDTLQIWDSSSTLVQLGGGSLRATTIDTNGSSRQFQWVGGVLSFDAFVGDLTNPAGLLTPGENIVAASVLGNYSQLSGGVLAIELGGSARGETYDHFSIGGNFTAGGDLAVSLIEGFEPSSGAEFDVLDFLSLEGRFTNVLLPQLASGLEWDSSDLYTEGVLRVFDAAIPTLWTGAAGDGDYFNPENWEPQLVPTNEGDQAFALTIPEGADLSIPSAAGVRVTRLTQAEGSTIEVEQRASFEVDGANLAGTILVAGQGANFATLGADVQLVGAPRFWAQNGGELRLFAERYDVTADFGSSLLFSAEGAGSFVDAARLEAISVDVVSDSTFTVAATDGGEIDLSGVELISGVTGGPGQLVLRAASGGTLRLGGSGVSARTTLEVAGPDGLITVDGGLILDAPSHLRLIDEGTISLAAPLFNHGTISGSGTIRGVVFNNGIISPGNSVGETEVEGDMSATENAVFSIEILGGDGMDPPQNDRVTSTQRMMLAGHLVVMLIEGGMGIFDPLEGDEFELFSAADGITGRFDSVSLPPLPPEDGWKLQYNASDIALQVVERLPGDFDADGDVDRSDLSIWQGRVAMFENASQTDGDADGDLDVDGHDLIDFLVNFGRVHPEAAAANAAAVPEPHTAPLAVLLMVIVTIGRAHWVGRRPRVSAGQP